MVDVAIIGGGFSGTVLAVQLLRRSRELSIGVIDKSSIPGRGLAYSTQYNCHLLNVPAGNMSALQDDHTHSCVGLVQIAVPPSTLKVLSRAWPTDATSARSSRNQQCSRAVARSLQWSQEEAVSLTRANGRPIVLLKNGRELQAEAVILAIGDFPPGNPKISGLTGPRKKYVPFAWSPAALEGLDPNGSVLLIGSGLTSIDLAIALQARKFQGRIQNHLATWSDSRASPG